MHKFSNLPGYYPNSYNLLSKPCYIFLNAKVKGKYYYSKMWEFVAICCIPGTISLYKVTIYHREGYVCLVYWIQVLSSLNTNSNISLAQTPLQ